MPVQQVKGVNVGKAGNSLAAWLAAHHPDLFVAMFKKAQATKLAKGLGRLAQDEGLQTISFDPGSIEQLPSTDLNLETFTFDAGSISQLPSTVLADDGSTGSNFLANVSSAPTSAGTTVGSVLASVGSTALGAIASVGSALGTSSGLQFLTALVNASKGNPTQQTVLQTQVSRAATGKTAAPITYQNGVPVYATQTPNGAVYQALTTAGVQSYGSSSLAVLVHQYGLYILLAGAAVVGLTMIRR